MLTCRDFISDLTDYLDETTDAELRVKLEKHMAECPNCWVVCDTTRKTISVYKNHEKATCIPADVQARLLLAVEKMRAAKAKVV